MKRTLLTLLLFLAVVYAGLSLMLFLFQEKMIYFPAVGLHSDPSLFGLAYEPVEVVPEEGVRVVGWYLSAPEAKGTVLFSHGNAGNIEGRLSSAQIFMEMGLSVLLYDYRGYGASEGRPDEEGLYRDAETVYDWLRNEKGVAAERILLYGESLGVGVSIELAGRREVAGVIAESGFSSMKDVAAVHYPWLPVGLFLQHHYDNAKKIGGLEVPVLIVHSPDDEIVPFAQARVLFEAASEPKELLETGGGHNDGGFLQREEWRARVRAWAHGVLPEEGVADGDSESR